MTGDNLALIISAALGTLGVVYGAWVTFRLGHEKNRNDENQQQLTVLAKHAEESDTELSRQQAETEARVAVRKAEREQDRKDLESALEQSRADRAADRAAYEFQRTILLNMSSDISGLRTENLELTKQVAVLSKQNDIYQRELNISEADRRDKSRQLETTHAELIAVANALRDANNAVLALRQEVEALHVNHDLEMKHLNTVYGLQKDDLQHQINSLKEEHNRQIEQFRRLEGPRNLEMTNLRYTLRQVHKDLSQEQIEKVSDTLLDRGLSYDSLLFPRPDPLLIPMISENPPLASDVEVQPQVVLGPIGVTPPSGAAEPA